jgi:hypothetical protein
MKLSFLISPQKITRSLPLIVLGLIVISILSQFSFYFLPDFPIRDIIVREFHLDEEGNFPSAFSAFLLLWCFFLIKIISEIKKRERDRYKRYWRNLAFVFLYLSLDELVSLHENVINPLRRIFGFAGFLRFAWVVPAAILLVFLIFYFFKFFLSLQTRMKISILLAGCLYIGGGMGIEMINGKYVDLYGKYNFNYAILMTIEESLEMFGIVIMINTLLTYLKQLAIDEVNIGFDFRANKAVEKRKQDLIV